MKNWELDSIISNANKMQETIDKLTEENKKLKAPNGALKVPHNISFVTYSSYIPEAGYIGKVKESYDKALVLAKENDTINAYNRDVFDKLKKMIITTGFPETTSVYKRNKRVSVPSEWTKCLTLSLGVGSYEIERRYKEFLQEIEKYTLKEKALKEEKARMEEAAIEEKKKEIAFVDLCRDLGMDPLTTTSDDVMEHLLSQCKYLNLAHAGQATRNDWSDGFWRVSNALSKFTIDGEIDRHINEEYTLIMNSFEDGRSFRDCEYNYDVLFSMVDPKLMAFYERLNERFNQW